MEVKCLVLFVALTALARAQECGEGQFERDGECMDCSEGCAECSDESTCSECLPDFGDDEAGGCEECDFFVENCRFCSEDPGTGEELITNGSFEDSEDGVRVEPLGWTGTTSVVSNESFALDENQFILMNADETISQSVSGFIVGQQYTLTFYCSESNSGNTVTVDGEEREFNCDDDPDVFWEPQTFSFTAASETIEISIAKTESGSEIYDLFSILAPVDAVCPECNQRFLVNSETGQCESCPDPNCLDCSQTPCRQCAPGLQVDPLTQMCQCIPGTFLSTCGECVPCYDPSCSSCTPTECTECAPGFVKSLSGVCECRKGFFLSQQAECEKCSDPNCFECSSSECLSCSYGFFLRKGVCLEGNKILDSFCSSLITTYCKCSEGRIYGDWKCEKSVDLCDGYYKDGECFHCLYKDLGRGKCN